MTCERPAEGDCICRHQGLRHRGMTGWAGCLYCVIVTRAIFPGNETKLTLGAEHHRVLERLNFEA